MVIFLQRTFTSLVNAHVGRTQGRKRGRVFRSLRSQNTRRLRQALAENKMIKEGFIHYLLIVFLMAGISFLMIWLQLDSDWVAFSLVMLFIVALYLSARRFKIISGSTKNKDTHRLNV